MADKDFTATENLTPQQLAEKFPCNYNPFGIWYDQEGVEYYNWAINDENGDGFTNTIRYETASILSEALKIRHQKISNNEIVLDKEQQKQINYALLIGLESFGEIERISDEVKSADHCPNVYQLPDSIRPIHPTGANDTISVFTAALRYIQRN